MNFWKALNFLTVEDWFFSKNFFLRHHLISWTVLNIIFLTCPKTTWVILTFKPTWDFIQANLRFYSSQLELFLLTRLPWEDHLLPLCGPSQSGSCRLCRTSLPKNWKMFFFCLSRGPTNLKPRQYKGSLLGKKKLSW